MIVVQKKWPFSGKSATVSVADLLKEPNTFDKYIVSHLGIQIPDAGYDNIIDINIDSNGHSMDFKISPDGILEFNKIQIDLPITISPKRELPFGTIVEVGCIEYKG